MMQDRDRLAESLMREERRADAWRLLLVDMAFHIGAYLKARDDADRDDVLTRLLHVLFKLGKKPENTGSVLIRWRGTYTGAGVVPKTDYIIRFNDLSADTALVSRKSSRISAHTGRLVRTFNIFHEIGIHCLHVEIPNDIFEDRDRFRIALDITSQYTHAVKTHLPIVIRKDGTHVRIELIQNEKGRIDPNLTLLAGINGLKPKSMQSLVEQVGAWMARAEQDGDGDIVPDVYNAIFEIQNLKETLSRPPLEINNIRWLFFGQGPDMPAALPRQKVWIIRLAAQLAEGNPTMKLRFLQSIYGDDFALIDAMRLERRLDLAGTLLLAVEHREMDSRVEQEILNNIRPRLESVREDVIDILYVKIRISVSGSGKQDASPPLLDERIWKVITGLKGRFDTKRKLKAMVRKDMEFNEKDYQVIASDFRIPLADAEELVMLIRNCFDQHGRFIRRIFERHIPELAWYEEKVFEFLWFYLKDLVSRSDRVAFLNSLQSLIGRMKKNRESLRILMDDFYRNPDSVSYSDRNALMLANLLVRKYNKELKIDIELTPEETLLVWDGLDKDVTSFVEQMLERDREKVFQKVKAIHGLLIDAMQTDPESSRSMPPAYLISLERELFIFLSLVGGGVARSVLTSAVRAYGNPGSDIYRSRQSARYLQALMLHVKVVIRGLGRVGTTRDTKLLKKVRAAESEFMSLGQAGVHADMVRRLVRWVDHSVDMLENE